MFRLKPNGHHFLGGIGTQKMFEVENPTPIFPFLPPQLFPQETDVSIAREVDKDLEANGEAGAEDAGESASARHAAREKQREAGIKGGDRGFCSRFTTDVYIDSEFVCVLHIIERNI